MWLECRSFILKLDCGSIILRLAKQMPQDEALTLKRQDVASTIFSTFFPSAYQYAINTHFIRNGSVMPAQ